VGHGVQEMVADRGSQGVTIYRSPDASPTGLAPQGVPVSHDDR